MINVNLVERMCFFQADFLDNGESANAIFVKVLPAGFG